MPSEPPLGLLADRYRVGPVVGRGAMGEVRTAHDERLQREVAVKFLRPDLTVDPAARGRFEEEAHAAARISHPNAVTVFDTGEQDGAAYIVMERLPGRTLADEIAAGALDPDRARQLVSDVLGALGVAHALGVLHRDIKPGNILLTVDGRAKLADFGIAKTAEGLNHTVTGEVMGTPAYMAPERLEGSPATPQSDLYSIGVVLYEALTGQRPFAADTPLAVIHAVFHAQLPPLGETVPRVDPALARAVEQAMERDPARRFGSAAELQAAIESNPPGPTTAAVLHDDVPATVRINADPPTEVFVTPPIEVRGTEPITSTRPAPAPEVRTPPARSGPPPLAVAAAAAVAVAAVVWFVQRDDGGIPASVTTTTVPEATGLPPEFDDALEHLEEVVQP